MSQINSQAPKDPPHEPNNQPQHLDESSSFVEAVMAQRVLPFVEPIVVESPTKSTNTETLSRKRALPEESPQQNKDKPRKKKAKNSTKQTSDDKDESTPNYTNLDMSDIAKMMYNVSRDIKEINRNMHRMNNDMQDMIASVNKRVDQIEKNMEHKITTAVDKRINKEISKIKKVVEDASRDIRVEVETNYNEAKQAISDLQSSVSATETQSEDQH